MNNGEFTEKDKELMQQRHLSIHLPTMRVEGDFAYASVQNERQVKETMPFRLPSELHEYNIRTPISFFVERPKLMQCIVQAFQPKIVSNSGSRSQSFSSSSSSSSSVLRPPAQPVVLGTHGLSGVGKTQLALHYCYHTEEQYQFRAWFQADDRERLQQEYLRLAQEAGLIEPNPQPRDISPEIIRARVKDWLGKNPGWLLVYDNAPDYETIKDFLPASGGDVLITSKSQAWTGKHILVTVMELEEGVMLIKNVYQRATAAEEADIKILVEELGRLPLAIVQAAAYIQAQDTMTVAEYLEHYRLMRTKMLEDDTFKKWSRHEHEPVAVTWLLTIEELRGLAPEAERLLEYCSFFDNHNIPQYLLRACMYEGNPEKEKEETSKGQEERQIENRKQFCEKKRYPAVDFFKLQGYIRKYSLFDVDKRQEAINIHQLVQTIIQEQLSQEKKENIILRSVNAIDRESLEKEPTMNDLRRRSILVPHLELIKKQGLILFARKGFIQQHCIELPISLRLAEIYDELRDPQKEKILLERALAIERAYYGIDHWEVTITQRNLANVYITLGKAKTQKADLEHILKIQEAYFGENHWQVAETLGSLAVVYGILGDVKTEKSLIERALSIQEVYYGKDHRRVALTLGCLSNAYGALGDVKKQKMLLEQVVAIFETYYGKDHYRVAEVISNLAIAYGNLGDIKTKKSLLERALTIEKAHYGEKHWQVARTLTSLASAHGDLGDPETKKTLLESALVVLEMYYGRDHWEIATVLAQLASAYGDLGDIKTKKAFLEHVLAIEEEYYGKGHWKLTPTIGSLAVTYSELGDPKKAKQLLEDVLAIKEAHYGKEHQEVAATLGCLAVTYGDLGDVKTKKTLLEQVLAMQEAYYGKGHWKISGTLGSLANAYGELGDIKAKKILLERTLATAESYYGRDHWKTVDALVNLANAYGELGDLMTQKVLLERSLVIDKSYYGEDHWKVAVTLGNLAVVYGDLGDAQMQKVLSERVLAIQEAYYGKGHWQVAETLGNLSTAYGALGNVVKQRELLERALIIFEAHYGQDHWKVAAILTSLSSVYGALGNTETKKELLERAIVIREAYYGKGHWKSAKTLGNLANTYGMLGDIKTQKDLLERVLRIKEAHYGEDHRELAITLVNLGNTYGMLGEVKTQKGLLERALVIQKKSYGEDHWQVAITLVNLSTVYAALHDTQRQKLLLERALVIQEAYYGKNHWRTAATLENLSIVYDELGDTKIEKILLERVLAIKRQHFGEQHGEIGATLYSLGLAYAKEKDYATGLYYFQQAKTVLLNAQGYGEKHPKTQKVCTVVQQFLSILSRCSAQVQQELIAHSTFQQGIIQQVENNLGDTPASGNKRDRTEKEIDRSQLKRTSWAELSQRKSLEPKFNKIAHIIEKYHIRIVLPEEKYREKASSKGWQLFSTNAHNYLIAILLIEDKEHCKKLIRLFSNELKIVCNKKISPTKPCLHIFIKPEEITDELVDLLRDKIKSYFSLTTVFISEQPHGIYDSFYQSSPKKLLANNTKTEEKKTSFDRVRDFDDPRKYKDNDITDYKQLIIRGRLGGFKSISEGNAHQFLLEQKFIDNYDENKECFVVATDTVDTAEASVPINYFLDKYQQVSNPIAIILSTIIIPVLNNLNQNQDDVLREQLKRHLSEEDYDDEFRENIFRKLKETNFDRDRLQKIIQEAERECQSRDVFEELMPEMLKSDVSYAKIVFPYNKTNVHWLSGEIKITKNNHNYVVEVYAHDPYGSGQMTENNFNTIKETIERRIRAEDPEAIVVCTNKVSFYKRRQREGDAISCGIIVAEDIIKLIQCQSLDIETPYEYGALNLREKHCEAFISQSCDLITKERFLQRFEAAKQAIRSQQQALPIIIHQSESSSSELSSKEKDQLVELIYILKNEDLKNRIINAITNAESYHAKDGSYLALIKSAVEEMPILLRSQNIEIGEADIQAINQIYRIIFNKYVAENVIYELGSRVAARKSECLVSPWRDFYDSAQISSSSSRYSFHTITILQQSENDTETKKSIINMQKM